jgi:hypothetical protein
MLLASAAFGLKDATPYNIMFEGPLSLYRTPQSACRRWPSFRIITSFENVMLLSGPCRAAAHGVLVATSLGRDLREMKKETQ